MAKNIIISWHIPSYGIGFFKNVLSCFYTKQVLLNQNTYVEGIHQTELENGFYLKDGFLFDKAYYFYFSDETCNKLSDRRKSEYISGRAKIELINDELIKNAETLHIWEDVFLKKFATIAEELRYVEATYSDKYETFQSQYWRNIHYYPIEEQINWFKKYSNAKEKYDSNKIEFVDFTKEYEILELRDEDGLTNAISKFMTGKFNRKIHDNIYVNSGLGTVEMQLAWRNVIDYRAVSEEISLFSIVDQKENTPINYRFRDLKFIPKEPNHLKKEFSSKIAAAQIKDYVDLKIYPLSIRRIYFNTMSFITTCDSDNSHNDKYIQLIDGSYYRLTKVNLDELSNLLPADKFCRISRYTIVSNQNNNVIGWEDNCYTVILSGSYVENEGFFWGGEQNEKNYKENLIGKPIKFSVGGSYWAAFKKWMNIDA